MIYTLMPYQTEMKSNPNRIILVIRHKHIAVCTCTYMLCEDSVQYNIIIVKLLN